jgi:hypothetical protein
MAYRFLAQHSLRTAEAAEAYLRKEWGLKNFRHEESVDSSISHLATLQATTPDHHIIWVEVSDRAYPKHLDAVVLDCVSHSLPVRLVVAVPAGLSGKTYAEDLARARQKGIGVLAVSSSGHGTIVTHPLSLSLASVTPVPRSEFPDKYKYALSQAESTFRDGNPAKACDDIYGMIEALTRRIAAKTYQKGLWKAGSSPPRFDRDPWASVMDSLVRNLDPARCNLFKNNVFHRVLGVIPHRNQAVHIPKNRVELTRRDRELRTRFEEAVSLLLDLAGYSKSLRV